MSLEQAFFALLRLGIGSSQATEETCGELLHLSMKDWKAVMNLASGQGVMAIATDGLQALYDVYVKEQFRAAKESPQEWMMWTLENAGQMIQYEQRCEAQKRVVAEMADLLDEEGVKMMVFKGQANAALYPNPNHRATGDIDCYLFGEADKGDRLLSERDAKIDNSWYRHSKILYKGETIENHRVMSHTRGGKKRREMEEELRAMVRGERLEEIDGCSKAVMPTAQFNACFLTYHGLHHFTSEGLRMKQVLDWAVFLKEKQEDVDWVAFDAFCERYGLERFAAVMNYIASEYLGVELSDKIHLDGSYAEKVIRSTLFDDDYLFNAGLSDWEVRWLLVKNMLTRDRWKYEKVAGENVWKHLCQSILGFVSKAEG